MKRGGQGSGGYVAAATESTAPAMTSGKAVTAGLTTSRDAAGTASVPDLSPHDSRSSLVLPARPRSTGPLSFPDRAGIP